MQVYLNYRYVDRKMQDQNAISMEIVLEVVGHFLEHLDDLVFSASNPLKGADYFAILFDKTRPIKN